MDHINWYYKFLADVDWLNDFMASIERTDRALVLALTGQTGVGSGFTVTEKGGGQNFSVDISAGSGYDPSGRRFFSEATQNLPFVEDELGDPIEVIGVGKARVVAIYAHYALVDKPGSEAIDGFGDNVFTIQEELVSFHLYQGAIADVGLEAPPADPGNDMTLLAYVQIRTGDLTVANADIDESVKQYLSLTLAPDIVNEENINWGLGASQVSAVDVPIEDVGGFFAATNVEIALQELAQGALAVAVPIGSIIPWFSFNNLVAFDTDYWDYCRGQVIADASSPLNGQTMPDLSGRYLCGFGTDGGADMHTAPWSTAAVGNAQNQINIQHSHTVTSHTHTLSNHTHTGGLHTHDYGSLYAQMCTASPGNNTLDIKQIGTGGNTWSPNISTPAMLMGPYGGGIVAVGIGIDGETGSDGNVATGVPSNNTSGSTAPGTDNQLSTTQSIQPRSIRVRYIMRKR